MVAVLMHTTDMLGDVSCNGMQVLVEYSSHKKLKRQSEKYYTFFYVRQWIEIVYVKVS